MLCACLAHYHLPVPECRYVCTVKVAQRVWPQLQNHKLDTVSQALGIELNHHEAGSDARAAGLILQAALRETASADADELAEKIGMRLGRISCMGTVPCSIAKEFQGGKAVRSTRKPCIKERAAMKNYLENIDREALRARAEQMLRYADDARNQAGRWTDYAVSKAQGFSVFDFAIFKVCLLSWDCGWAPAFRAFSRNSAAFCSLRLRQAGCICSGASSLTAKTNKAGCIVALGESPVGEEYVCGGADTAK